MSSSFNRGNQLFEWFLFEASQEALSKFVANPASSDVRDLMVRTLDLNGGWWLDSCHVACSRSVEFRSWVLESDILATLLDCIASVGGPNVEHPLTVGHTETLPLLTCLFFVLYPCGDDKALNACASHDRFLKTCCGLQDVCHGEGSISDRLAVSHIEDLRDLARLLSNDMTTYIAYRDARKSKKVFAKFRNARQRRIELCDGKARARYKKVKDDCASARCRYCCSWCGKQSGTGASFPECSGCHVVRYCTSVCQKAHWKLHGRSCKDFAKLCACRPTQA